VRADDRLAIAWRGREVRIEAEWLGEAHAPGPTVVFLHEGLGSRSLWRDFPAKLCEASGARGFVFSRPGYGRSSWPAGEGARKPDYLHRQAYEVLPAVLAAAGLAQARPRSSGACLMPACCRSTAPAIRPIATGRTP
jgi:pimeloyl-ACP methyl ester carboxylesterase